MHYHFLEVDGRRTFLCPGYIPVRVGDIVQIERTQLMAMFGIEVARYGRVDRVIDAPPEPGGAIFGEVCRVVGR